ncbi:MAG: hypothetical protein HY589_06010 [Candidatus Omnitrophica bacterium]|nr:hypothetical protein [Candidatus Omnitrophota bacterium]
MRAIILKALTSVASKKQDLCIEEIAETNGVLARTERHCRYFILGKAHVGNVEDLAILAEKQFADIPAKKRHYYILKAHDSERREDRLVCKLAGSFYAVCGGEMYCIAYVHSFKIRFTPLEAGKNGEQNDLA